MTRYATIILRHCRTKGSSKAPKAKHTPGQRRLVSFGGGITLSQEARGNEKASPNSPNRADWTLADEDALLSGEKDENSSDEDVVLLKWAASGTEGFMATGKRGSTPRASSVSNSSHRQSQSQRGFARISGGRVTKEDDAAHQLQANKTGSMPAAEYDPHDYFERLVSGADLFEPGPCAAPSSSTCPDIGVGKGSGVDSAVGAIGGADLGEGYGSDGGAFAFTRVKRLKRPIKRRVESTCAARASRVALEIRSSSDSDGSGSS